MKHEQRLSNQLKKPERGGEEMKKLKLSKGKKKQTIWSQSMLISPGGTNCRIETLLAKEVSTN